MALLAAIGCMVIAGLIWDRMLDMRPIWGLFAFPIMFLFILLAAVAWLAMTGLVLVAISLGVGFT